MPGQTDLYIFVEGADDERFFRRVAVPLMESRYRAVRVITWSGTKPAKMTGYLRSITSMGAEWIFVTDNDESPCVTSCKERAVAAYRSLDPARIIVVVEEIESWYLAGASDSDRLPGMNHPGVTHAVTKENLPTFFRGRKRAGTNLLLELIEVFSVEAARRNNHSFDYFYRKYLL